MFPSLTVGGLVQGPTTGNISDPASQIADNGLVIAQIDQLKDQLEIKANSLDVANALLLKEDTLQDGGVAQSKVANLSSDLASKASNTELSSQIVTRHPLIGLGELPEDRVANLTTNLALKASNTELKAVKLLPDIR